MDLPGHGDIMKLPTTALIHTIQATVCMTTGIPIMYGTHAGGMMNAVVVTTTGNHVSIAAIRLDGL